MARCPTERRTEPSVQAAVAFRLFRASWKARQSWGRMSAGNGTGSGWSGATATSLSPDICNQPTGRPLPFSSARSRKGRGSCTPATTLHVGTRPISALGPMLTTCGTSWSEDAIRTSSRRTARKVTHTRATTCTAGRTAPVLASHARLNGQGSAAPDYEKHDRRNRHGRCALRATRGQRTGTGTRPEPRDAANARTKDNGNPAPERRTSAASRPGI